MEFNIYVSRLYKSCLNLCKITRGKKCFLLQKCYQARDLSPWNSGFWLSFLNNLLIYKYNENNVINIQVYQIGILTVTDFFRIVTIKVFLYTKRTLYIKSNSLLSPRLLTFFGCLYTQVLLYLVDKYIITSILFIRMHKERK